MAFCEMCGAQIPDGQTRCDNCTAPKTEAPKAQAPAVDVTAAINQGIDVLKDTGINFIGIFAQIFNILMLCLPVLRRTHIWELGDIGGEWYLIPIAVILVIGASVLGYLLKQGKIGKIAGIVNLVALLIVWFPMAYFSVGFYLWVIGVVLQLASPYLMKLFKQFAK